jgi:hypothetical protein
MKRRLHSGNACYHAVQNLSSSRLSSLKQKIIYRIIILPVVLYACKTWPLTLKQENRLRLFEIRVLKRIFGPKKNKLARGWEGFKMRSFITCSLSQVYLDDECKEHKMTWTCSMSLEERNARRLLAGKPE